MQWPCQKWFLSFRQAWQGFGGDSAGCDETAAVEFRENFPHFLILGARKGDIPLFQFAVGI
jgi:hypothetical protein